MKIVVALDSFKGTMTAKQACARAAAGIRDVHPDWTVVEVPMADGGEGTAAALAASRGGEMVPVPGVQGPLPEMNVEAEYAWLPDTRTAVVEMASASGLPLLSDDQKNPMRTNTFGTGQVVRHAVDKGCRQLLLTLGGSATVDGGTGCAAALGWRFLDRNDQEIIPCGAALVSIATAVPPDDLPSFPSAEVLCDVTNPLCGPNGAAAVYGPQKGATAEMVRALDAGLAHLAEKVREATGLDVADVPGGGAAGGFGAGAMAFLHGKLVRGIDAVAKACKLEETLRDADAVVTGEGRFDAQSLQGKVVDGVKAAADRAGIGVAVLAGCIEGVAPGDAKRHGIERLYATGELDPDPHRRAKRAAEDLQQTARRLVRKWPF